MSTKLSDLFAHNRAWAALMESERPGFFTNLKAQQKPRYMWIGCSDSRVPANQITGLEPGEVFVHRNVANVVVHSDLNALSTIQFAVERLQVAHVMVVGHYGCSGVNAAMRNTRVGIADNWLRHVQDVRNQHHEWVMSLPDGAVRLDALCELNVLEQSLHVCQTTVVQDAWARGQQVDVHGWVYGLHSGLIKDLRLTVGKADDLHGAYAQAVASLKARYARHLPAAAQD